MDKQLKPKMAARLAAGELNNYISKCIYIYNIYILYIDAAETIADF